MTRRSSCGGDLPDVPMLRRGWGSVSRSHRPLTRSRARGADRSPPATELAARKLIMQLLGCACFRGRSSLLKKPRSSRCDGHKASSKSTSRKWTRRGPMGASCLVEGRINSSMRGASSTVGAPTPWAPRTRSIHRSAWKWGVLGSTRGPGAPYPPPTSRTGAPKPQHT